MIINIGNNLKLLPYGDYTGYILSKKDDPEKIADGKDVLLFLSLHPRCFYLFVKYTENLGI